MCGKMSEKAIRGDERGEKSEEDFQNIEVVGQKMPQLLKKIHRLLLCGRGV